MRESAAFADNGANAARATMIEIMLFMLNSQFRNSLEPARVEMPEENVSDVANLRVCDGESAQRDGARGVTSNSDETMRWYVAYDINIATSVPLASMSCD